MGIRAGGAPTGQLMTQTRDRSLRGGCCRSEAAQSRPGTCASKCPASAPSARLQPGPTQGPPAGRSHVPEHVQSTTQRFLVLHECRPPMAITDFYCVTILGQQVAVPCLGEGSPFAICVRLHGLTEPGRVSRLGAISHPQSPAWVKGLVFQPRLPRHLVPTGLPVRAAHHRCPGQPCRRLPL